MTRHWLAGVGALTVGSLTLLMGLGFAIEDFWVGPLNLALLVLAGAVGW